MGRLGRGRICETKINGIETDEVLRFDCVAIGEQTFYVVKLVFPRGDAASLLLGLNAQRKITGISLMSMAGD